MESPPEGRKESRGGKKKKWPGSKSGGICTNIGTDFGQDIREVSDSFLRAQGTKSERRGIKKRVIVGRLRDKKHKSSL